jgi:uncharacterized protein involved in outer membrane biogenesis
MSVNSSAPSLPNASRRWLRRLATAVGAFVLLTVLAWLAVPPIARGQLESHLSQALGRKTTIESVEFNPLQLRFTIRKLAIGDTASGLPLLTVDELVANLSSASLLHRAPVFDALVAVHPVVSLGRDHTGLYTVHDLIDKALAGSDGPTPKFSINNIEVDDGSVRFDDELTGRKHRIDKLAVGIPFLSSLPYQTDIKVTPRLEGVLNGSHFALDGTTEPFAERREATIEIDVDALPLPDYLVYLPAKPRVALAGGALTTRLKLIFVDSKSGERTLDLRGDARIDRLTLNRRDGSPLAAAERVAVGLDRVDLLSRVISIASVAVDAPNIDMKRLSDGTLELAQPLFDARAPSVRRGTEATRAAAAAPDKPWTVTVASAAIKRGAIALADETSAFRSSLADLAIDATNLSTKPGEKAHVKLSFVSADRIATFRAEADVEPLVPAATGTFDLTKFSLGLLFPYYKDVLAVDVQKGSLDLAAHFALGADGNLKLSEGVASIADLALAYPGNKQPFWRFPSVAAGGVEVDLRERKVKIAELQSRGAMMKLARDRDGSLDVARLMKTTATTGTGKGEGTWTLAFGKLLIERASIDVEDRVAEPPVKLAVRDIALAASDYSNARGAKSAMTLRARVDQRGRIAFSGPVGSNPVSASGQLEVSGLDLVALRPFVESRVNVTLTGGALAAKGSIAVEVPEQDPIKVGWKGNVTITDFAALDRPTASDLARWKRLALEGVDVATDPFRMAVGRIGAEDYYARVIVYADGTLNLTRLLTPGGQPEPASVPKAVATPSQGAPAREPLPITIGRIDLAGGKVNYSDFFVRPNYSANLTDVTGSVTTMSAEQAGDIAIAARVDGTAPVEISGRIHPFAKDLSLDIAAKARDVDLPPLTPYSVKYAGYGIERGKLTFDVHYRVENRKLVAENRLFLDQLTFNPQRIDSPTATKLPVLLAVALLKDTRGVIDVHLPISGSLDDPKFSVGGLIIQVIVNLIAKAATAPFALLSAAFGKGEELSTIPFEPGSPTLGSDAQQRLDTLSKALADRPALKLDIGGRADPAGDREALRRAAVESAMKHEKMKSMAAAGNAPASVELVTIGADERVRWLTAAYRASSITDRPRNVIGMLEDVPPARMEALLLAGVKVDDDALRLLANARAESVKEALAEKGVAGERLFLTAPRLSGESEAQAPATGGAPSSTAVAHGSASSRVDLALR